VGIASSYNNYGVLKVNLAQYNEDMEQYYEDIANGMENVEPPTPPTPPTPVDPQQFLADQLAQAKELASILRKLAKMGLAPALINQLAGMGAAGIPVGQALLEGGQELIDDFNETYAELNDVTNGVVGMLGDTYFGGAIAKAKNNLDKLADRLEKFIKKLSGSIDKDADDLAKALKRLLSAINSVIEGLGGKAVESKPPPKPPPPAPAPGPKPTPSPYPSSNVGIPPIPVSGGGGFGWGTGSKAVTVNVYGWVGSDQQIATKVRDELVRIERNNGRVF